MDTRKERRMNSGGSLGAAMWLVTTTMVLLHCCTLSQAQYAKSSYYMNSLSDCNIAGFWVMRSDDVVNIFSRRPGSTTSDLSDCAIRLKLDDARDILDVTMSEMQINDRDVVLTVDLTGGATWTLTGGSKNPGKMTAKGGQVTISLTRLYKDQDNDYYFSLIVRAYKESDLASGNDESPVAVGLVVGIVGGIIGFLIFIAVIVVCCWRRRKRDAGRPVSEYKEDLTTGKGVSPADSYGLDNAARNGTSPPRHNSGEYFDDSPRMKKQLLNDRFEYRDQSDTESESKDPYIMKRFDQSPTKRAANLNYENENRRPEGGNVQMRNNPPASRPPPVGNAPRNPPPAPKPPPPPVAAPRSDQNRTGLPPKSPVLDALHKNPRFRASYHANEDDADDRARRISGDYAKDDGHESDASMTMTWNTTFDTNFDDDPRPPTHSFVKPPTLPPVPKSPKAALRRENTASIRRNPRPSSSSSEIEQIEEGRISMNPKGSERDPPPVRGEVVPIRIQDPHSSPTMKRKPDTQHTLRPDRSGGQTQAC